MADDVQGVEDLVTANNSSATILNIELIEKNLDKKILAVIAIIGFLFTLFTFFGVNYLLPGLHSYGAT